MTRLCPIPAIFRIGLCALFACSWLTCTAAESPSGEIELGAGYVSDSQFKFGEFNGLEDSGLYPILNFSVEQRPSWKTDERHYWSASGRNLGLDNRALALAFGDYDHHQLKIHYREISRNGSDSGRTVFSNAGSSDLVLPAGWVSDTTTAGMTGLSGPLGRVTEAVKRQRLTLDYQLQALPEHWTFDIGFKHETKQGQRLRYGIIGNTGGNPRAVALPAPIDYAVSELALRVHNTGARYSLQFGYDLSLFANDHRQQSWDNPFLAISGWEAAAGYPTGRGSLAQEPDNRYQQLFAQGSLRVSSATLINASMRYALLQQDEDFLPYTVNPALAVTIPLPRSSLDGEIAITAAKIGLQQRLSPRLQLKANASYEERDNRTPRELYIYIGGDSQDQDNASSSRARYNLPYSYREESAEAGLRYRWLRSSTLTADYRYQTTSRDYSEVSRNAEQRGQLGLDSRPSNYFHWRLNLSREQRDSSTYRGERPYFSSHTNAYIASEPADERFENHPLLRKYYLADRDRDRATLRLNVIPEDQLSIGLTISHADDDYEHSAIGLKRARLRSAQADIATFSDERYEWSTFLSYEQYHSEQAGHSFQGFAIVPNIQDPGRSWQHDSEDRVKTLGSNLTIYGVAPKTDMTLGYLLAFARSELETTTGTSLSAEPLPRQGDKLIQLSAEFLHHFSSRLDIALKMSHETYDAMNFSTDNVTPDTLSNVIVSGEATPSYSLNWYQLSVNYRF